jgi:hypothetical protein
MSLKVVEEGSQRSTHVQAKASTARGNSAGTVISEWEVTMNSYDNEGYHRAHTGTKMCVKHLPANAGQCSEGRS